MLSNEYYYYYYSDTYIWEPFGSPKHVLYTVSYIWESGIGVPFVLASDLVSQTRLSNKCYLFNICQ